MLNPISDSAWPAEIAHLKNGFAGKLNVWRTVANHPDLVASMEAFRTQVVTRCALTPFDRELVILRAAHFWNVFYEWEHHVVRGREAGLSDADIERVKGPAGGWAATPARAALLSACDDLLNDRRISPPVLEELARHYDNRQILDVLATVGLYHFLAMVISTFEVPLDATIHGIVR